MYSTVVCVLSENTRGRAVYSCLFWEQKYQNSNETEIHNSSSPNGKRNGTILNVPSQKQILDKISYYYSVLVHTTFWQMMINLIASHFSLNLCIYISKAHNASYSTLQHFYIGNGSVWFMRTMALKKKTTKQFVTSHSKVHQTQKIAEAFRLKAIDAWHSTYVMCFSVNSLFHFGIVIAFHLLGERI